MEQKEQRNRKYVIYIQKCACQNPQCSQPQNPNLHCYHYPMTPKSRSVQFSSYRVILALIYRKTICSHY